MKATPIGHPARIALAAAMLWSLALVVAALTAPLYSGESESTDSTGTVTSRTTSATLVDVNGWWGLVVASLPLVACLGVGALLLGPGGRAAVVAAAVVVALLGVVTVLGMLSIGIFLLPVTAALTVAVASAGPRPVGPRPVGPRPVGA